MLKFESKQVFRDFVIHGYCIVITGGSNNVIIAAAAFIVEPDGLFLDAIAVSHGKHPKPYKVPNQKPDPKADEGQRTFFHGLELGNYQKCGLGRFLLAVLARFVALKCPDSRAIYLKCPAPLQDYYTKRGYLELSADSALPSKLFAVVPLPNYQVKLPDTTLFHKKVPPLPVASTPVSKETAAAALASLRSSEVAAGYPKGSGHPIGYLGDKSSEPSSSSESIISVPEPAAEPRSNKGKKRKERTKRQFYLGLSLVDSDDETATRGYEDYAEEDKSNIGWTLPDKDYWEPQTRNYKAFQATEPEALHQLSQKEVEAKYGFDKHKALGRLQVLRKAAEFCDDTKFMHSLESHKPAERQRYSCTFSDQEYIDFAAVADFYRPIAVQNKNVTGNGLVKVSVSSYLLSSGTTLASLLKNPRARQTKLNRELRTVTVAVSWLLHTCRPEISDWISETLHGTKVQSVGGAQVEGNFTINALSLAFSGKIQTDKEFVPLPQGHVRCVFSPLQPPSPSKGKRNRDIGARAGPTSWDLRHPPANDNSYYDVQGNVKESLIAVLKKEAALNNVPYTAPPPKADTQVVKLKWVPTRSANKDRESHGMWHGAFAVRLGADKAMTVLQECGLLSSWVEEAFALPLRTECKKIALGGAGKRNPKHYLFIPAGDVHNIEADPPPESELLLQVGVAYVQGKEDSCVRHSFASVLDAMGFVSEAKVVAADTSLVGCNLALVQQIFVLVRRVFAPANLQLRKLHNHACSIGEIAREDALWPIILIIQTSDGCYGTHAVTTWNGMLFDSNCGHALCWSQKALDWCSGKGSSCVGFSRAYRLCPAEYGLSQPPLAITVGMHVSSHGGPSNAIGWIMRLPSKKRRGYHVRHTDGATEAMSVEDVARFVVAGRTVGGV
jgi:hypothetical protein